MTGCEDEHLMQALKIVRREYDNAVRKHPEFATTDLQAVSIITEEVGELAKELNEACVPGAHDRAITEAAHVAVSAIRTMQMLMGE